MAVRLDRSKLNAIAKAKKLFVSETCLRFCAIDSQISFLALAIVSKKIQNHQWNSRKVVAIWGCHWDLGFSHCECNSCGTVDKVVATNTLGPGFEFNHYQFFTKNMSLLWTVEDTKIKKKKPGMAHLEASFEVPNEYVSCKG